MKKIGIGIVALALTCTFFAFQKKDEIKLFNGKDLSGWEVYGTEKWYVEKGLLISESGPDEEYGYLGTKENYKDFELNLEFKQRLMGTVVSLFVLPSMGPRCQAGKWR